MNNQDNVEFTTPIGRLVSGDVYHLNEETFNGKPVLNDKGEQKTSYYIGIAVPKHPGVTWEMEPWGQLIMQVAKQGNPGCFDPNTGQLYPGKEFAFKVNDGDQAFPNRNGRIPVQQEGHAGHWILNFKNGFAPKTCNADGSQLLLDPVIKRGHYIQVKASITANTNQLNPGVFLNHLMVAHSGFGPEIIGGPDPKEMAASAGFGQSPAPQGMSQTPVGGMATNAAPVQNMQQQPVQNMQPAYDMVQQSQNMQQQPVQNMQQQPVQNMQQPQPAYDMVQQPQQVEESYNVNGQIMTRSQILSLPGMTEQSLAQFQKLN